jgi:hypothetical protein
VPYTHCERRRSDSGMEAETTTDTKVNQSSATDSSRNGLPQKDDDDDDDDLPEGSPAVENAPESATVEAMGAPQELSYSHISPGATDIALAAAAANITQFSAPVPYTHCERRRSDSGMEAETISDTRWNQSSAAGCSRDGLSHKFDDDDDDQPEGSPAVENAPESATVEAMGASHDSPCSLIPPDAKDIALAAAVANIAQSSAPAPVSLADQKIAMVLSPRSGHLRSGTLGSPVRRSTHTNTSSAPTVEEETTSLAAQKRAIILSRNTGRRASSSISTSESPRRPRSLFGTTMGAVQPMEPPSSEADGVLASIDVSSSERSAPETLDVNDDEDTESTRPDRPLNNTPGSIRSLHELQAELVDTQGEMERMERQLLKAIKDDAVVAEVVEPEQRKRGIVHCGVALAVVAAVVVTAAILIGIIASSSSRKSNVAPTMSPTLPPQERISQLLEFINSVTWSNGTIAYPPVDALSSPEEQAFAWIIEDDPVRLTLEHRDRFLQRFVLVSLWTSNPDSDINTWRKEEFECTWVGVNCDTSGNVVGINLSNKKVKTLPEDLGILSHLHRIELDRNVVTGTIPSSLALMSNLTLFNIEDNRLSGTVPWDVFAGMSNLEMFAIHTNLMSGSFPTELGRWWPHMVTLTIYGNSIQGTIPSDLRVWSSLEHFEMGGTLSGSLPTDIGDWTKLKSFSAGGKLITGSMPSSIGSWTDMEKFVIGDSPIRWTLPSTIGTWANLTHFGIYRCDAVGGTLPSNIGALTNLISFEVSDTLISGTLPSSIAAWTNIQFFAVLRNDFRGSIPAEIADHWLDISAIGFSGNSFTGTIPSGITKWSNILAHGAATFENNEFTGTMPLCDHDKVLNLYLKADCGVLNCTCCTKCCPAWRDIGCDVPVQRF